MVIHKSARLHMRVNNRASDKLETTLDKIFAQRIRLFRSCRNRLGCFPFINNRFAADETPDVFVKCAEFFLYLQKSFGIVHCRINLQLIANNCGILKYFLNSGFCEFCHFCGIEIGERLSVPIAFFKDRGPAKSRLGALEYQKFEMFAVVMDGVTPFFVMVLNILVLF